MADEIMNAPENMGADISDTVPEKPKRKRTTKKTESAAENGENINPTSPEQAGEATDEAKPPVKRKPRKKPEDTENKDSREPQPDKPKTTRKRKPKVEVPPAEAEAKTDGVAETVLIENSDKKINTVEEITAVDLISEILNGEEAESTDTKDVILEVPTVELPTEKAEDVPETEVEVTEEKETETAEEEKEPEAETQKLPPLMNVEHFFDYHSATEKDSEEETEQDIEDTAVVGEETEVAEVGATDIATDENTDDATVIQEYENYTILDEIEEEPHQKEVRTKARKSRDDVVYNEKKPRAVDKKFDMLELFIFTLVAIMVLTTFVFKHSVVEGGSMENTLQNGDHLIISDLFYKPKQYDLIVFQDVNLKCRDKVYTDPIVKRVIATGGQHVVVEDMWTVYVDGVLVPTEYATVDGPLLTEPEEKYLDMTVPEGEVYVMGDHRNASDDSRYFGTVKEEAILGKVIIRIYPFQQFGIVKPKSKDE